jgi:four helix bundle protein
MKGTLEHNSFQFSIRIVNLTKYLKDAKKENIMSKQLLRCGTSIGANIAEAQFAQSKADFVTKMHIALKEASETRYWLSLLKATEYLTEDEYNSILKDCNSLINMLVSTCKTTKNE